MLLTFSPLAADDLESIGDYIARDDPARAHTFVAELRAQCQTIASAPLAFRSRDELGPGLRSCAHRKYVIFYRVEPDEVVVVRVLHGARDLPTALRSTRELGDSD